MTALYRRNWFVLMTLALLSLASGVIILERPAVVLGFVLLTTLAGITRVFPSFMSRVFLVMMAVILIGYAFFDRAFAYIGFPPVFIGEVTLAFGILTAIGNRERWAGFRSPVGWLLAAFGIWGAVCTLPYIRTYGVDALRDAVVWGYGLFALLLVPLLLKERRVERVPGWFAACVPWFLVWAPVALSLYLLFNEQLPLITGTDVRILHVKPGDLAVHLGGIGAFLLLGLHRSSAYAPAASSAGSILRRSESFWWVCWSAGFIVTASINRGGMLSASAALAIVLLLRPGLAGRRVLRIGAVVVAFILALIAFDVSWERDRRDVSARQVAENFLSVTGSGTGAGQLEGTKRWRLMWWDKIIGYTVHGQYFWTGKGYGINVAVDDGFERPGKARLRSPHNGHLTILARSGVPGAVLWILLQGSFAAALLVSFGRARRRGDDRSASTYAWILAYWGAFMTNTTFDVALEGPQLGIPFWSLFGLGLAAVLRQQAPVRQHGISGYRPPAIGKMRNRGGPVAARASRATL